MPYKIIGISGSPVKSGNTDTFLKGRRKGPEGVKPEGVKSPIDF